MKLVHYKLKSQFEFIENRVNVLIIENAKLFNELVMELYLQINNHDGNWILSDNKDIAIDKCGEMLTEYFNFSINSKAIQNKLYKNLKEYAYSEEMYMKTITWQNELHSYMLELADGVIMPIEYNSNGEIMNWFKAVEMRLCEPEKLSEKIISYIEALAEFQIANIVIFVNLKSYLGKDELAEVYKSSFYNKIHLFLVESVQKARVCEEEKLVLVDKDLCEIY